MMTRQRITFIGSFALAALLLSPTVHAGDNIEEVTGGGTVISHKLWDAVAMPLRWSLHSAGVIDNDSAGHGTPNVTNAEAANEIGLAFQIWADVATSNISVAFDGETAVADSGCDMTNVITWSDANVTWDPGVIAMGLTTSYVGSDLVLTAANRGAITCGAGSVALPVATYPNGMTLRAGTILDMDMTWNPSEFDYGTVPNATPDVFDIRAVAAHEFGHLFGFSHTSMAFSSSNPATMFPAVSDTNVLLQNNIRTLEADDAASSGGYPGVGHWPTGTPPFVTGAVSGRVLQAGGAAASGVRVWAYDTTNTAQPAYETFSLTEFDWDPSRAAGDYIIAGMRPGTYYLCIVPWDNGVPSAFAADAERYNLTTLNGDGNTGFPTECYDDVQSPSAAPSFTSGTDRLRKVTVGAGATTPSINFVTGAQTTDFVLVMDRSGSMSTPSATPGVNKIQALQNAANAFLDFIDLAGGHRVGLVQFEESLVPFAPPFNLQTLNAASLGNAHSAINGMGVGGMTNIISGVNEGISQLTTIATPRDRQIMLVFSDGQHNRPIGSDLNSINSPLVSNGISLYSVGFGTDVDDAILSQVALNTGGVHVNEQDLDALALSKHFLSIAASAADATTLIDPRYSLSAGEKASLSVPVLASERDLSFAVHWSARDAQLFDVTVKSPSGCTVSGLLQTPGVGVRRGATHRLVKIALPFTCNGKADAAGTWTIEIQGARKLENRKEEVELVVFGSSRTQLYAATSVSGRLPLLIGRLMHEATPLRSARMKAEIILPLPQTFDSEKQDGKQDGRYVPPKISRKERTLTIELRDDGSAGDAKAGDGQFSAALPLAKAGTYAVRLIAEYRDDKGGLGGRELLTGYHFNGKEVLSSPPPARRKLRTR